MSRANRGAQTARRVGSARGWNDSRTIIGTTPRAAWGCAEKALADQSRDGRSSAGGQLVHILISTDRLLHACQIDNAGRRVRAVLPGADSDKQYADKQ